MSLEIQMENEEVIAINTIINICLKSLCKS